MDGAAQLNDQIFPLSHAEDRNFKPPPEAKEMEVRSQLHNLVMDQVCSDLGQPHPSDEALRSDIAAVQGKMNLSVAWSKDEAGNLPFVSSFDLKGGSHLRSRLRSRLWRYSHSCV